MRLNRVLLLAATISVMMFALLFTISCSGDDGKNGKPGKGCTAEANGNGSYDVSCDGEFMGILEGTADHKGKPGTDGKNGKDGSYCIIGNQTATNIEIKCNGEVKGTLDACDVKEISERELQIACGKSTLISVCRIDEISEIFDPTKKYCDPLSGEIGDIGGGILIACQGDKKATVNKITHYCGYASATATKRTAIKRCHYSLGEYQPNTGINVKPTKRYADSLSCAKAGGHVTDVDFNGELPVSCPAGEQYKYDADLGTYACSTAPYPDPSRWTWGGAPAGAPYNACYLNLKVRKGNEPNPSNYDIPAREYEINSVKSCLDAGGDTLELTGSTYTHWDDVNHQLKDFAIAGDAGSGLAGKYFICVSPWQPGQTQYCRYTSSNLDEHPITSHELCGQLSANKPPTINEGSWKGEYCGYLSAVNSKGYVKSVQNDLCDDYDEPGTDPDNRRGPNEDYYNAGYCQVLPKDRITGKTSYTHEYTWDSDIGNFCNAGTGTKGRPNNRKWAKEYCGWTAPVYSGDVLKTPSKLKVYSDICDDGKGPQEDEYGKYNYCEVTYENRLSGYTTLQTTPCGTNGTPNKNTWQKQYCGPKKEGSNEYKVWSGICDDGIGPNQYEVNKAAYCQARIDGTTFWSTEACELGSDNKINVDTWKGEYCGFADADASSTSKLTGACGDEDGSGPNSSAFGAGYCRSVDKNDTLNVNLVYSTEFCGENKETINEGSWKGEYCGYASESMSRDKKYTGACDDGYGPNYFGFGGGFCGWNSEEATGTELTDFSDACPGVPINEGSWKGEACYADGKVAACTGGRLPLVDKNSTDPFTVRCTYTKDEMFCTADNLGFCDKDGCADLGEGYTWNEANSECLVVSATTD